MSVIHQRHLFARRFLSFGAVALAASIAASFLVAHEVFAVSGHTVMAPAQPEWTAMQLYEQMQIARAEQAIRDLDNEPNGYTNAEVTAFSGRPSLGGDTSAPCAAQQDLLLGQQASALDAKESTVQAEPR